MVYIDGMRLDEHYGNEIMENPGIAEEPLTLGEDEYLYLEIIGITAATAEHPMLV